MGPYLRDHSPGLGHLAAAVTMTTSHGEVVYIGLSLTAKSLLAWLIFANVLRT